MSLLNRPSAGLHNVLITLYRCVLAHGPSPRDRLLTICGPADASETKAKMLQKTLNTWKNRVRAEKSRGFWKTISFGAFGGDKDDDQPDFEPAGKDAPLDTELEKEGTAAVVQKALLQLDTDDRAIVVLREIEERSYGEIGAMLGLPEGTVKSRLFRARAKLKTLLDKVSA